MHEKSGAHVTLRENWRNRIVSHGDVDPATLHEPSADGKHGNHEQWPNV